MALNFKKLNQRQLEDVISKANAQLEVVRKRAVVELRRSLETQIREAGFTHQAIFGGGGVASVHRTGAGVAKYRDPKPPHKTWSGFGRKPAWMEVALAAGVAEEKLLIDASQAQPPPAPAKAPAKARQAVATKHKRRRKQAAKAKLVAAQAPAKAPKVAPKKSPAKAVKKISLKATKASKKATAKATKKVAVKAVVSRPQANSPADVAKSV